MNCGKRMALGLAGGYLLGRGRKGRLLLLLAAVMAGRGAADGLIQRGVSALESSPQLKALADQGKAAAVGVVGHRIDALTDRIHTRTEALRQPAGGRRGEERREEARDEDREEAREEERDEDREGPRDEHEDEYDEEEEAEGEGPEADYDEEPEEHRRPARVSGRRTSESRRDRRDRRGLRERRGTAPSRR